MSHFYLKCWFVIWCCCSFCFSIIFWHLIGSVAFVLWELCTVTILQMKQNWYTLVYINRNTKCALWTNARTSSVGVWWACSFNHISDFLFSGFICQRKLLFTHFCCFFFALELCRYHAWAYGYNLSLMQSNYLEMPVDTKLIQLT